MKIIRINGRKRYVITHTLGLVWVVVVHGGAPPPANQTDGVMAHRVVEPCGGLLSFTPVIGIFISVILVGASFGALIIPLVRKKEAVPA